MSVDLVTGRIIDVAANIGTEAMETGTKIITDLDFGWGRLLGFVTFIVIAFIVAETIEYVKKRNGIVIPPDDQDDGSENNDE